MPKSIKSITNPKLHLEILTPQEIKKIHDATLWIIEKVGVRFPIETRPGYLGCPWRGSGYRENGRAGQSRTY